LDLKFAAIDVGSNAMRLLLGRVFENNNQPFFKKESLIRMPIRLGDEAFTNHFISNSKADSFVNTMIGFKYIINAYQPINTRACATSAMREAENGDEIVKMVKQKSGIDLKIIDGKEEAALIYANHSEKIIDENSCYLYIDVGGGSTELSLFAQHKTIASKSFNIGTVRLLKNLVKKGLWKEMKRWIKNNTKNYTCLNAIGTGGNINKIFRLANTKEKKPISYKKVKSIYSELKSLSFEDRIQKIGLRPDRADVILPASEIYLSVMKWAKIKKIYVPQVGLADGLIHVMFEDYKSNQILTKS